MRGWEANTLFNFLSKTLKWAPRCCVIRVITAQNRYPRQARANAPSRPKPERSSPARYRPLDEGMKGVACDERSQAAQSPASARTVSAWRARCRVSGGGAGDRDCCRAAVILTRLADWARRGTALGTA